MNENLHFPLHYPIFAAISEMPMKIYTKTGDRGQTSLVGGQRVSKCCERLESYGTVDELNSHIGELIIRCGDEADRSFLTEMQGTLFVVGGYLATDTAERPVRTGNIVTEAMVEAAGAPGRKRSAHPCRDDREGDLPAGRGERKRLFPDGGGRAHR